MTPPTAIRWEGLAPDQSLLCLGLEISSVGGGVHYPAPLWPAPPATAAAQAAAVPQRRGSPRGSGSPPPRAAPTNRLREGPTSSACRPDGGGPMEGGGG